MRLLRRSRLGDSPKRDRTTGQRRPPPTAVTRWLRQGLSAGCAPSVGSRIRPIVNTSGISSMRAPTKEPRIDGLDAPAIELTARESQLIELARQGLTNAEIADRLVISVRTVETHLYRGMQKLGTNDRRDL